MQTGPLILVADDEAIILKVVAVVLRKAGFRVLSASCATQALQLVEASEEPISLAVLDVVMPDLDGPQLCVRLRETCPDLRVLFISGYNLPPSGLPTGADFLSKPFTSAELLRRVNAAVSGPLTHGG
ncbi:MAG TPA: response regulator [Candidatus Solibacter sp.]|jgi:CheY-like chemotaxis protein